MLNLAYHLQDFNLGAAWTFSSAGHGKGPCDGLGAVGKSTARKYQLKQGPEASFCSPEDFYRFTLKKNDRLISQSSHTQSAKRSPQRADKQIDESSDEEVAESASKQSRPIQVLWLEEEDVRQTFDNLLKPRWNRISPKGIYSSYPVRCSLCLFEPSRSYRGYSKFPRIRRSAEWRDRLSRNF
jgi:hypothetical protein